MSCYQPEIDISNVSCSNVVTPVVTMVTNLVWSGVIRPQRTKDGQNHNMK